MVAAPIAAVNLAQASARLAARPIPEGTARALGTVQTTARFAVGIAGLLLIAVSYAGWLHPPALQRRWKWETEPVVSYQRAAEQIHQWRTSKALPEEARVLNLQTDLANYIAWFAPGQRTFFDSRLGFLAPEAEDFAAVRRRLWIRTDTEAKQDQFDFPAFLRNHGVVYAVAASPNPRRNQFALNILWKDGVQSEWALGGRRAGRPARLGQANGRPKAAVAGLRSTPRGRHSWIRRSSRNRRTNSPPRSGRWTSGTGTSPPRRSRRRTGRSPSTTGTGRAGCNRIVFRHTTLSECRSNARPTVPHSKRPTRRGTVYWWSPAFHTFMAEASAFLPVDYPPEVHAVSVLSVRSGRRAVVASPDHPDGYFYLAKAYQDMGYLIPPVIRMAVTTANLARCMARLPTDPANRGGVSIDFLNCQEACQTLYGAHMSATPPRRDLAQECLRLRAAYLRQQIADVDTVAGRLTDEAAQQEERH